MKMTKENGVEGPLPSSIKPGGFHCYQRGGCHSKALCEDEDECLGVDPPQPDALNRNSFDEIAKIVQALTYGQLIEFAGGLWGRRGKGEVNGETLPKILHAWATRMELASGCAVHNEPALPTEGECAVGKKFQPIDTAPKDRPILAFMLGRWRIARWKPDHPHKRPIPFWSADDLRVAVSRAYQPKWWAELPPSPPEAEA